MSLNVHIYAQHNIIVLYFVFFHLYNASLSRSLSETLLTTALMLSEATDSEGLDQGSYVAARVGFEPAALLTEETESHH